MKVPTWWGYILIVLFGLACRAVTIRLKEQYGVCWCFVLILFEIYGLGPYFSLLLSSDYQCVLFIRRRDGRLWRRHGECWHGPNGVWIRYITHSLLTFPSPPPPLSFFLPYNMQCHLLLLISLPSLKILQCYKRSP